jgi:uncharacterized membrane protein
MNMQNRFKSWALWVAVASFVALFIKTVWNYEIPNFDALVNGLLGVLVLAGIVNNPTDNAKF